MLPIVMKIRLLLSSATWVSLLLSSSAVSPFLHLYQVILNLSTNDLLIRDLLYHYIDLGAAYGTAKSGVGICSMGVLKPDLIFKSIVPIIMAGILGIYGLIVAVILNGKGKSIIWP